jgi:hypothetical protein
MIDHFVFVRAQKFVRPSEASAIHFKTHYNNRSALRNHEHP